MKKFKLENNLLLPVDLNKVRRWSGQHYFFSDEYFFLLRQRQKTEKVFCVEHCTGCGKFLFFNDEDLAGEYYYQLFLGEVGDFLEKVHEINPNLKYIEVPVCEYCVRDLFRQEKESGKEILIDPIPLIKKI